jgi:nicotinate phosphoribosyltransferase
LDDRLLHSAYISVVYPANGSSPLHTMLTDTYTIKTFFDEFTSDPERALRWNGLRHDSGDPIVFGQAVKDAWTNVATKVGREVDGVIKGKKVIFSDGLDVPESLRIWNECERIGIDGTLTRFPFYGRADVICAASFGIGTNLTNDFKRASDPSMTSKPLNIVIKLRRIDGLECVKLTDDKGKYTGAPDEVRRVLKKLKGEELVE